MTTSSRAFAERDGRIWDLVDRRKEMLVFCVLAVSLENSPCESPPVLIAVREIERQISTPGYDRVLA
jgi:hypothetical protein